MFLVFRISFFLIPFSFIALPLMPSPFISGYFNEAPGSWGLRGDPLLWQEMKKSMEGKSIPLTAYELEKLLHKQFLDLTGENARPGRNIYVERLATDGLASGLVSSDFWLTVVFPLILQRFEQREKP